MLCLFAFLGTRSSFTVVLVLPCNLSQTFTFLVAGIQTSYIKSLFRHLIKKDPFRIFPVLNAKDLRTALMCSINLLILRAHNSLLLDAVLNGKKASRVLTRIRSEYTQMRAHTSRFD